MKRSTEIPPPAERTEPIARFKGEFVSEDLFGPPKPTLKFLVSVNVPTTGFDAANTARLILDYDGNIMRHGPIDMIKSEILRTFDSGLFNIVKRKYTG